MDIYGIVKDAVKDKPLAGAKLKLYVGGDELAGLKTDNEGKFELKTGTSYVGKDLICKVEKEKYKKQEVTHRIEESEVHLEIELVEIKEPPKINWVLIGGGIGGFIVVVAVVAYLLFGNGDQEPPRPVVTTTIPSKDTKVPEVTIDYKPFNPTSEEKIKFTAKASDESGISETQILIDNKVVETDDDDKCVFSAGPFPRRRSITYSAVAVDKAGNKATTKAQTIEIKNVTRPTIPPSTACEKMVQGKIAWDYKGSKTWNPTNVKRLCKGAENSAEPAKCFERVMHGRINWGGGTQWAWKNALDLCEGTLNANATISCFQAKIKAGIKWPQAIKDCEGSSPKNKFILDPRILRDSILK